MVRDIPDGCFPLARRQWLLLAGLFIIVVSIWVVLLSSDRQGTLTVAFLDVGQGDAMYIETPSGNQMLIDGGAGRQTLRPLGRMMPFYDRSVDLLLATHPDQDHIGGFPAVIERMDVRGMIATENTTETGAYHALEDMVRSKHIPRILARSGERIILDHGVVLDVLFPDRNTSGWETNAGSIIARLSYGKTSFLFTGDSPVAIERYLSDVYGATLRANVLKLGHHGSRTSSSREFVSAVGPDYAIISAGKGNRYGHPHQEVVETMRELGILTLSTAEKGTIVFRTDGESLVVN